MDSSGGGDGNGRIGVCKPSTSTGRYWTQGGIRAGLRHHGAALHALPCKQSNLPRNESATLGDRLRYPRTNQGALREDSESVGLLEDHATGQRNPDDR